MHLERLRPQAIGIEDRVFDFTAGERLHTENSYEYTIEEFHALARRAALKPKGVWTYPQRLFSMHAFTAAASGGCNESDGGKA